MVVTTVEGNSCGYMTSIRVCSRDLQHATVQVTSDCEQVVSLGNDLGVINCYDECFRKFSGSRIFQAAERHCRHLSCPVPTAIVRSLEVACQITAHPQDVHIRMTVVADSAPDG